MLAGFSSLLHPERGGFLPSQFQAVQMSQTGSLCSPRFAKGGRQLPAPTPNGKRGLAKARFSVHCAVVFGSLQQVAFLDRA